jgi:Ca2+-binding EF-hand superfamily protein
MSRTLSKEEAKDVQKAFQTIDENKDGVITVAELAKVMLKGAFASSPLHSAHALTLVPGAQWTRV